MSDSEWQILFETFRANAVQASHKLIPPLRNSRILGGVYDGDTQFEYFRTFINDILRNIRKGKIDYCFNYEHIKELLKYERDNLMAEWQPSDRCFKIYLK